MADTEPGSWIAVATFLGTLIGAVVAALAGIKRGDQRAARGAADGDTVGLGGSPLLIDSKPIADLTKEVAGVRRALEKMVKSRDDADDRAMKDMMGEIVRRLERLP